MKVVVQCDDVSIGHTEQYGQSNANFDLFCNCEKSVVGCRTSVRDNPYFGCGNKNTICRTIGNSSLFCKEASQVLSTQIIIAKRQKFNLIFVYISQYTWV